MIQAHLSKATPHSFVITVATTTIEEFLRAFEMESTIIAAAKHLASLDLLALKATVTFIVIRLRWELL
jgi:hypothetical protein